MSEGENGGWTDLEKRGIKAMTQETYEDVTNLLRTLVEAAERRQAGLDELRSALSVHEAPRRASGASR